VADVVVVIPARYGSSRFEGKALADLAGAPLVVRTAQRAAAMTTADRVLVATDDARIADVVRAAGFEAVMTGEHASGTDRIGEAMAGIDAEIVVNLQGDEPLLDPVEADRLVLALRADPEVGIATLAHAFGSHSEWADPNAVKVVTDDHGRALLFTRAAVPGGHPGGEGERWRLARRHVGIYAYRLDALRRFLAMPPHPLECAEGLEQLRALTAGETILVLETAQKPVGVDPPEDLERARELWRDLADD